MSWFSLRSLFKPDPLQNCTPRVQEVLKLARRAADDRFHDCVDTGHIMLGMLLYGEGVGMCGMTRLGVNFLRLQRDIERAMPLGTRVERCATIPYTDSAHRLIKRCGNKEAKMIGHAYFGTEHFLLGFLRLRSGAVYEALRNQGITIEPARAAVLACLSSAPEKDETTPNQALLPTPMSVTPPAGQEARQP